MRPRTEISRVLTRTDTLAVSRPSLGQLLFLLLITSVAALGGLLFGYDTAVISGAIGLVETHFGLTSAQTGWAASSAFAGCVLGSAVAGTGADRFGRHRFLLLAGICFLASALGTAMAPSFFTFTLFRILGGVGVGIASLISPLYIAESSPAHWRGRLRFSNFSNFNSSSASCSSESARWLFSMRQPDFGSVNCLHFAGATSISKIWSSMSPDQSGIR